MNLWICGLDFFYYSVFSVLFSELMSSAVTRHLVKNKCGLSAEFLFVCVLSIENSVRFDKRKEVLKYKTKVRAVLFLFFNILLSYGQNQTH